MLPSKMNISGWIYLEGIKRSLWVASFACWYRKLIFDLQVVYLFFLVRNRSSKIDLTYVWAYTQNRYIIPLSFIVNMWEHKAENPLKAHSNASVWYSVAYTLQTWSVDTCQRYVVYEGVMTAVGIEVVALMMLLRCVTTQILIFHSNILSL